MFSTRRVNQQAVLNVTNANNVSILSRSLPSLEIIAETILGRHSTLEVRSLHLGGLFHAEEEIQMTATMPNFVGQLQGFVYNGHRYDSLLIYCKLTFKVESTQLFNLPLPQTFMIEILKCFIESRAQN